MVWANEHREEDLSAQVQYVTTHLPNGPQIGSDATNFVRGINAYIALAKQHPLTMIPAEYFALEGGTCPAFKVEDVVRDRRARRGHLRQRRRPSAPTFSAQTGGSRPGIAAACRRSPESPPAGTRRPAPTCPALAPSSASTPQTIPRRRPPSTASRSPTKRCRRRLNEAGIRYGPGSVQWTNHVVAGGPRPRRRARRQARVAKAKRGNRYTKARIGTALGRRANAGPGLAFPRQMSNALLVSGAHTVSGHPIAVMGPQTSTSRRRS